MDGILAEERWKFVMVYLDDIFIYSKIRDQHFKHLELILNNLKDSNVTLNKEKCSFFKKKLKYWVTL